MNENLQKLEVKIENQGTTPQGKVSAPEWNILVAAVKALDAAGIDTETLAKYLKQYQYVTTPKLEELLKDVTENLDGVVDLKSAQAIEGLKDFINGFKIGGVHIKYDAEKKALFLPFNLVVEGGVAWNSSIEGFNPKTITEAVQIDNKTIKINDNGALYVAGGTGGGGFDEEQLANYLAQNRYVTEEYVSSVLTDYAPISTVPTNNNQLTNGAGYITGISSQMVTDALGYTPLKSNMGFANNLSVTSTDGDYGAIIFFARDGVRAWLMYNGGSNWSVTDDGWNASYALIHAGNISNQNVSSAKAIKGSNGGINLYDHLTAHDIENWAIYRGEEVIMRVATAGLVIGPYDKTSGFIALRTGDNYDYSGDREVRLLSNGNLGVGIIAPEQKLHVNGNILATGRIAWNSSRVLKNIIDERYLTLDEMLKMKPYTYTWKDGRDNIIHVGAVADDIKKILPETVLTDSKDIHSMDYAQTAYVMCASLARELAIAKEEIRKLKGVA